MTEIVQADIAIIGAGVIGCAIALKLIEKFPNQTIIILESGPRLGEGITSRNSGVIHSGLYYKPQSLKAETSIKGNSLLYAWAERRGVPFKRCGKLIIARGQSQIQNLEKIFANAQLCEARDLELVSPKEIQAKAPQIKADAAIWAPWSGIIDPAALTRSYALAAEELGAIFMYNHEVTGIENLPRDNYKITTEDVIIESDTVVNASGLNSDDVSKFVGIAKYKIFPCRGDYFTLLTSEIFKTLLYPVKEPHSPGLGVHLTFDMAGRLKVGPDAEYVDTKTDFRSAESKQPAFEKATRSLLGSEIEFQLRYDTCGIRPKLKSPSEDSEKDFVISEDRKGFFNLVGIESPGLTAALSIAEIVANQI